MLKYLLAMLCVASATLCFADAGPGKDKPVLDTSKSPHAILHGVPVSAVKLEDGFWASRRKVNVEVSLPSLLELFEQNGIIDNFRRASGKKNVSRRGPVYTDSDIYKWLEAVGFEIQSGDAPPALRSSASAVIDDIVAAQDSDGYIDTAFMGKMASQRHTKMTGNHELYCLGHLIQAGIAWYRADGDRRLLEVGQRMVEYLLKNFGPDKKPIFEGHPEIELSLIELYRTTGDHRYLDFAGYFLKGDPRNLAKVRPQDITYLFTVEPFTQRKQLEGHAVRAMYACSGATDYFLETGNQAFWQTLTHLWDDLGHKMYITGGVGSRAAGEAFGEAYELPNRQAYTESCAAIGNMFWNWRMLQATGDSKYADVFERALYNGANSGLSLSGNLYCYRNPLELVGDPKDKIRNPWYTTTCCPPNLQRILGSLPGYFYSTSSDGLWVHLYDHNTLDWHLEDGTPIKVTQSTRHPWDGTVELTISPSSPRKFTLHLRKPAWSPSVELELAGTRVASPTVENGYLVIRRTWNPQDRVVLKLDMSPRVIVANPLVNDDVGKVAITRGPLLYCIEGIDQPGDPTVFDWSLNLDSGDFRSEWSAGLLGGIETLRHRAWCLATPSDQSPLYQPIDSQRVIDGELMFIPYYAFHNRGITSMEVWVPYRNGK
ncbi:MAG TPA: beta-L-arabinofuranosidase domain-containing protein [Tepidisphaeraceae bacterium]|nr:beta-L-arabinofuranosidase domain-containing protein [Tepidisphaeraceae bacterium]